MNNSTPTPKKWWPTALVDEVLPVGTFAPDDWIVGPADGEWVLGPQAREEAREYGCLIVQAGDEVGFTWMEPRGSAKMLIYPDATWQLEGDQPCDFSHFYDEDDWLNDGDDLDYFARLQHDNEGLSEGDNPLCINLIFIKWGSSRFRLQVKERRAKFVPIEEAQ